MLQRNNSCAIKGGYGDHVDHFIHTIEIIHIMSNACISTAKKDCVRVATDL